MTSRQPEKEPPSVSGDHRRGMEPGCTRCGKCCTKGGPTFHREDLPLVQNGLILSKFLYTIRKGERVHDAIGGRLICSDSDLIKIKGCKGSWQCSFFEREKGCSIYPNRPLECKILKCWDTVAIEEVALKDLLIRQDLLSNVEGLWRLVEEHNARCDYPQLAQWIEALDEGRNQRALQNIHDALWYDIWARRLMVDKGGVDPEMLDFLLGRPLTETIGMFGVRLKKLGDRYHLVPK